MLKDTIDDTNLEWHFTIAAVNLIHSVNQFLTCNWVYLNIINI
jgi:hypothetical protein